MYHLMSWSLLHWFTFSFRIFFILFSPIFHILMFRTLFARACTKFINFPFHRTFRCFYSLQCLTVSILLLFYWLLPIHLYPCQLCIFANSPMISYINRYKMDTHCTTSSTSNDSIYIWVILIDSITFFVIITAVVVYLGFVDFPKFLLYTSKSSSNSLKDFI